MRWIVPQSSGRKRAAICGTSGSLRHSSVRTRLTEQHRTLHSAHTDTHISQIKPEAERDLCAFIDDVRGILSPIPLFSAESCWFAQFSNNSSTFDDEESIGEEDDNWRQDASSSHELDDAIEANEQDHHGFQNGSVRYDVQSSALCCWLSPDSILTDKECLAPARRRI